MVILDTKCELVNHWPRTVGPRVPVEKSPLGYVSLPPLCHCFLIEHSLFSQGLPRSISTPPGEDGSGGEADALQWRRVPRAQKAAKEVHLSPCQLHSELGAGWAQFHPLPASAVLALRTGGWSSTGTKVMGNRNCTWCLRPPSTIRSIGLSLSEPSLSS